MLGQILLILFWFTLFTYLFGWVGFVLFAICWVALGIYSAMRQRGVL